MSPVDAMMMTSPAGAEIFTKIETFLLISLTINPVVVVKVNEQDEVIENVNFKD